MNAINRATKWCLGLASSAGVLLGLGGVAMAGELPAPPADRDAMADRPSDNARPHKGKGERKAKNLVYLELLGSGLLYSVNYERMLSDDLSVRAGFSYWSMSLSASNASDRASAKVEVVTVPLLFNYFVGGRDHKLELGAGAVAMYASASASSGSSRISGEGVGIAGAGVVGYRYSPADGGFVFRAGFTPLVGKGGVLPWGGVSLGGTF